jgi:hypothetical protein
MSSFRQVFAAEVHGFVIAHGPEIFRAFQEHLSAMVPDAARLGASAGLNTSEACANVVYNVIAGKRAGLGFPLIRIVAGLHAIVRWRKELFKFNDFFDIHHAAAAIPYCDVFLTERDLKTVCTASPLNLAASFATKIISDEAEALDAVSTLSLSPVHAPVNMAGA